LPVGVINKHLGISNCAAGVFAPLCLKQVGRMHYMAGVSCRLGSSLSAWHPSEPAFVMVFFFFLEKNASEILWNLKCATFFFAINK